MTYTNQCLKLDSYALLPVKIVSRFKKKFMLFFKQKKTCPYCGMDIIVNNVCAYCGKKEMMAAQTVKIQFPEIKIPKQKTPVSAKTSPQKPRSQPHTFKTKPIEKQKTNPITKTISLVVFVLFLGLWFYFFHFLAVSFQAENGELPHVGDHGAIYVALLAFLASFFAGHYLFRRLLGLCIIGLSSLLLCTKPFAAPIIACVNGTCFALSVTSENHLYFLLPGLFLVVYLLWYFIKTVSLVLAKIQQKH